MLESREGVWFMRKRLMWPARCRQTMHILSCCSCSPPAATCRSADLQQTFQAFHQSHLLLGPARLGIRQAVSQGRHRLLAALPLAQLSQALRHVSAVVGLGGRGAGLWTANGEAVVQAARSGSASRQQRLPGPRLSSCSFAPDPGNAHHHRQPTPGVDNSMQGQACPPLPCSGLTRRCMGPQAPYSQY